MTYLEYLRLVRNCLDMRRKDDSLKGICWCLWRVNNVNGFNDSKHVLKLTKQLNDDMRTFDCWIDMSWKWRWMNGNILPYFMLTRNMRVNMRIRYIERLIRKEQ